MFKFSTTLDRGLFKVRSVILSQFGKLSPKKKIKITEALSCVLSNLSGNLYLGRESFVVPLNKTKYITQIVNGSRRKVKISYPAMKEVLDHMVKEGYITLVKGGQEYSKSAKMVDGQWYKMTSSKSSRVIPTEKLMEVLPLIATDQVRENVILLRDEKKQDITFKMNDDLRNKKDSLDEFNSLVRDVDIRSKTGNTYDCQLRKIFNNSSFKTGGRNFMDYGTGIQNLSKEERHNLIIEGQDTVIYDFVSYETSIAYELVGVKLESDPYTQVTLAGYTPEFSRDLCKTALNMMFNSYSSNSAAMALNKYVAEHYDIDSMYSKGEIPDAVVPTRSLIDTLEHTHEDIEDFFYRGSDSELSRLGSEIMDLVLDYFIQRGDIVLPVFDEVIAPESFEKQLMFIMKDAWITVLGSDNNFKIRKEK